MQELLPTIAAVLGVFLVIGVGATCRSVGWLTTEADRTLANLTANVMLPAYFIAKFSNASQIGPLTSAWLPPVVGFLTTAIGFGVAFLIARQLGPWIGLVTDSSQRAFALCAGICNYGYIPLPLAEEFYESAVLELILHNVGVDLALWSIGVAMIGGSGGRAWTKPFKSAPLWAVVFSITLSSVGLAERIPVPIMTAVGKLGGCAIPLGLLLSGAIIVDFLRDRSWLEKPKIIVSAVLVRQVLLPSLLLLVGGWLISDPDVRVVIKLQAAMPAAVFPIVLTKLYGRDTETALRVVLWTSIIGVISIPCWLAVGTWWLS